MGKLNWPFLKGRNITISRAEGVYLYDENNRPILDAAGGAIVSNIGHGRKRVAEAVYQATLDTSYVVPPWQTPSRVAMLESLADWLPDFLPRIHCTSGGTESNEAAMKIALHYQQAMDRPSKTKIIGRTISYHGTSLATASISGHPGRKKGLESALPHFPEVRTPYPLRCPLGSHHPDAAAFYLEALQDVIDAEGADTIAGLIAEPITGSSGGAIVPPDDYWPGVRAICDEHDIVLIMDEVMTGFGRTGTDFGYRHWAIEPDVLVSGKGFASGYAPLGGVFAREAIGAAIEAADFQVMFNTFGAHPAACAAAAEVLTIMREENLVARAQTQGEYLATRLSDAFSNHPHVAESRGKGLLQAVEVVADRESLERFPQEAGVSNQIVAKGLEKGIFFYGGGTGTVRDIVCMGPPLIVEESHIDQMVETLAECIDETVAALT